MVGNITSLTGHGLRDWLIQRVSSWVIAAYLVFVVGFIMLHSPLTFVTWHQLFQPIYMRTASILFLVALMLHAWIGVWTVTTDYLKCYYLRLAAQLFVLFVFSASFVWGIVIFWGM